MGNWRRVPANGKFLKMVLSGCFVFQTLTLTKMVTKMGFRQNGTFASKKEADDEEIGYHLVGPGL